MITIAICDDNVPMLTKLRAIMDELCNQYFEEYKIDLFQDGGTFLEKYAEAPYDILLLDICMPGVDGFEVAQCIRMKQKQTFLIFITSQEELVYQIFPYEPYSFIRKRSDELIRKDMKDTIKRLSSYFVQEKGIALETAYHFREWVKLREIIYIFSEKNYLHYVLTGNRSIKVRQTMQKGEEVLKKQGFLRIHRSLLVNMSHIIRINHKENGVYLSNGEILEIGRTYKNVIGEKYLSYLNKGLENGKDM